MDQPNLLFNQQVIEVKPGIKATIALILGVLSMILWVLLFVSFYLVPTLWLPFWKIIFEGLYIIPFISLILSVIGIVLSRHTWRGIRSAAAIILCVISLVFVFSFLVIILGVELGLIHNEVLDYGDITVMR